MDIVNPQGSGRGDESVPEEERWPLSELVDPETGELMTTAARYRSGPAAKPIGAYDYHEDLEIECWRCRWSGKAGRGSREYHGELFDVSCPRCDTMLLIVSYPTIEETKAAAAAGNKRAKANLEEALKIEARWRRADEAALKPTAPLPGFAGEELAFIWDFEQTEDESWTVIRLGDTLVWRELAFYEGWKRFNEVKEILKGCYGNRFRSLTPTERSKTYLYGDDWGVKISTT